MTQADYWSRRGLAALDAQSLDTAKKCFVRAVRLDRDNADRHFQLAVLLETRREFGAAAEALTDALHRNPKHSRAAQRLSALLTRQVLPETTRLNRMGLKAALQHDGVGRDVVADVAFAYLLRRSPLREVLEIGRKQGWETAARTVYLEKSGQLLRDDIFLELLRTTVVSNAELEQLLTQLRRLLVMEVPRQRLADAALTGFGIALMRQCWINQFVWSASIEERRLAAAGDQVTPSLLAGDAEQGYSLLLASIYQPTYETLARHATLEQLANIRPIALSDAIVSRTREYLDDQSRIARIPRIASLSDPTSRKVAAQYEAAPYPRWTRLGANLNFDEYRRILRDYFSAETLAFMDQPFEVLVAGCGTGMEPIQLAAIFGARAKLLAVDLSAPSLGYAARMADHFGVTNVTFAQADILELAQVADLGKRFHIVTSAGVLHHMRDPFGGWRSLLHCLKPSGLMFIGLYSAAARKQLTALRSDAAYPGANCNDDQLRTFRQQLIDRPAGQLGSELKNNSRDFYSMSGFRDLLLHVSERCHSLPEISRFLDENGLVFRGFQPTMFFDLLRQHYPHARWPGTLALWEKLEGKIPVLFAGMYLFWCEHVSLTP